MSPDASASFHSFRAADLAACADATFEDCSVEAPAASSAVDCASTSTFSIAERDFADSINSLEIKSLFKALTLYTVVFERSEIGSTKFAA